MLLVVGVSTNGGAYTPMQREEDTLGIRVSIHPLIINRVVDESIFVNYIPVEQASSRVTITAEIWNDDRLVENYSRRHFFWNNHHWAGFWLPFQNLRAGPYKIIVTFVGDENETISLYDRDRRLIDVGAEARIVKNIFNPPSYFYSIPLVLFMVLVVFGVWYLSRFPYQRVYPLCSDGRYG
jgi:hypothetical protein